MLSKFLVRFTLLLLACFLFSACTLQSDDKIIQQETLSDILSSAPSSNAQIPDDTPTPQIPNGMEIGNTFAEDLYAHTNSLCLSLVYDGNLYGPYEMLTLDSNLISIWKKLEPINAPDISDCTEWLTISSGDSTVSVTVYRSSPSYIHYEKAGQSCWYQKTTKDDLLQMIRFSFDSLEEQSLGRLCFFSDLNGEELLAYYGSSIFPEYFNQFSPGSSYRYVGYEFLSCKLTNQYADNVVAGTITFTGEPESGVHVFTDFAPTPGIGKHAGETVYTKEIYLARHSDGIWYPVSQLECVTTYLNDIEPWSPDEITPDQGAQTFLENITAQLARIREENNGAADLLEISELFVRSTTAVPMAAQIDFDWSQFCTDQALSHLGMQTLLEKRVNARDVNGMYRGNLSEPFAPQTVRICSNEGWVVLREITIYYELVDDCWYISDILLPFG